jgi:subtilase family serine protease
MNWSGGLPADSEYVIVVGGTRGNATYALTISIK